MPSLPVAAALCKLSQLFFYGLVGSATPGQGDKLFDRAYNRKIGFDQA